MYLQSRRLGLSVRGTGIQVFRPGQSSGFWLQKASYGFNSPKSKPSCRRELVRSLCFFFRAFLCWKPPTSFMLLLPTFTSQ